MANKVNKEDCKYGPRNEIQLERDYADIEFYYLRGYSLRSIEQHFVNTKGQNGRDYTLCFKQIGDDLKVIQARWRESRSSDAKTLLANELAKLDYIEQEATAAWLKSKEIKERRIVEKGSLGAMAESTDKRAGREQSRSRLERTESTGCSDYLKIAIGCIDRRCKLLRLEDVPKDDKGEITLEDIIHVALSPAGYTAIPGTLPKDAIEPVGETK
jgi:hypothetical protein